MQMNRNELKKICYKFNSKSNRVMRASVSDYLDTLKKYINYLDSTEIISDFINSCGECDLDLADDFAKVSSGELRFCLGETDEEEVVRAYSILKYLCTKYTDIPRFIMFHYSREGLREGVKNFNDSITLVLINHISDYLTEVGIDMGLDENTTFNIKGGQVNIANDNSTINAVQNNGIDTTELSKLISDMRNSLDKNLSDEEKEEANESIDIIESELKSNNPNEKNIKSHFKFLKRIDSGVKFLTSCLKLVTLANEAHPILAQIPNWLANK